MRGSRNRVSEAVIWSLLRDFSKHSEKAVAICAVLVPREMKLGPSAVTGRVFYSLLCFPSLAISDALCSLVTAKFLHN